MEVALIERLMTPGESWAAFFSGPRGMTGRPAVVSTPSSFSRTSETFRPQRDSSAGVARWPPNACPTHCPTLRFRGCGPEQAPGSVSGSGRERSPLPSR